VSRRPGRRPWLRSAGDRAGSRRIAATLVRAVRPLLARLGWDFTDDESAPRAALIGLDVSRTPMRLKTRSVAPVVVAALVGALVLAVLRMDVIRIRFGLADSLAAELELEEEKRRLTVEMRKLRDPAALSRRAHELGFGRAEQLIDLPRTGAPLPPPDPAGADLPIEFAAVARETRGGRP